MPLGDKFLEKMGDYIIWFGKNKSNLKFRRLLKKINISGDFHWNWRQTDDGIRRKFSKSDIQKNPDGDPVRLVSMWPPSYSSNSVFNFNFRGKIISPPSNQCWPISYEKMGRVEKANRLELEGEYTRYVMRLSDDDTKKINLTWDDTVGAREQRYVVETSPIVIQRCILMTTDPGDLVLDPTCGSGTTAMVAEQWGRRWITIDTSRVALALARQRIMSARYPYYLLADSAKGADKEGELTGRPSARDHYSDNIREGFVYERAPHITLKSIANNQEIDLIWETYQETLEPLRATLNAALGQAWEDWQIPRAAEPAWPPAATDAHAVWWEVRIKRQQEIDASIARQADVEYLYDRPYEDKTKVRVAGPFTVESLSPHRVLALNEHDEPFDVLQASEAKLHGNAQTENPTDFGEVVLKHLEMAGVSQADKQDHIHFTAVTPWLGDFIFAEGRYLEGEGTEQETERRAALFVGPEFGTIQKPDLTAAAREAIDGGFDLLIACGFAFDAMCYDMGHLGPLKILRARINPDLHMADSLKNTKAGNPFIVFGEPDIEILPGEDDTVQVKIHGMDVFDPSSGEVRPSETKDMAAWFIDTDYDEASFFVRHAYFLGGNDPYGKLKTTLKAEIDQEAWETLYSETSRPFARPASGRIAVKVINHFGDEVMKVFAV